MKMTKKQTMHKRKSSPAASPNRSFRNNPKELEITPNATSPLRRLDTRVSVVSRRSTVKRKDSTLSKNDKGKLLALESENPDTCYFVRPPIFKAIYGQGTQLKFVKLLFLLLKNQIGKYIDFKICQKRQNNEAAARIKSEGQSKTQSKTNDATSNN